MSREPPRPEDLDQAVRRRRARREEPQERDSFARGLAMIGALGWTIVGPTLLGIFAGRWLDRRFDAGIFWTLSLLVAGIAIGFALAWKRMHKG